MHAQALSAHLSKALGVPVKLAGPARPLGGGSTDQVLAWSTSHGSWVSKSGGGTAPRFSAEATQLDLIAAHCPLRVPRPLVWQDPSAREDGYLILPFVPRGPSPADPEVELARGLAALHRFAGEGRFGFSVPTFCGATPQDNTWTKSWVGFLRDRRLRPLVNRLVKEGAFSPKDERSAEALLSGLEGRLGEPSSPSLVHGDLWSGNTWSTPEGPALIDPAAAFAHREYELGMASWFGGFSGRFYAAYHEAWPLDPGWRSRVRIYRWFHELNHAVLFGGSYLSQACETLNALT